MTEAIFVRLLETPVDKKGTGLQGAVHHITSPAIGSQHYLANPQDFRKVPRSPFAYWASSALLSTFELCPCFENSERVVKIGLSTSDDFRFLRLWWEVLSSELGNGWKPISKGGAFARYSFDISLVINWRNDAEELKQWVVNNPSDPGTTHWSRRLSGSDYYFRMGLTYPLRTTSSLSVRTLPSGCIFTHKGPSVFFAEDDDTELLALLGIMNSRLFAALVKLNMGAAAAAARSYEVGVIQRTPIPSDLSALDTNLVVEAYDLTREADTADETTHAFQLPGLARHAGKGLLTGSWELEAEAQARAARLAAIQAELDEAVFALYGLDPAEVGLDAGSEPAAAVEDEEEGEDEAAPPEDLPERVQNLLMWCVGVSFGRWDVRFALDSSPLPALQGPFDPLPRCAPGALLGTDGLPATRDNIAGAGWLAARENVLDTPSVPVSSGEPATISPRDYPVSIAWNGILVDDPTHPADLVNRVRQVLALLWGKRAPAVEQEACAILGANTLRDYFRDPRKGFFPFHIKRYSKSRRKAPIYWLLQSSNRNYAIWLYTHRMDEGTYFTAARDYADTKVNLETTRLDELRQGLAALEGSALKKQEREVDRQQKLVGEVTTFRNTLDAIALRQLPPDPNDGVLISIAPLHELVPWKEAAKMWHELRAGKYEWSTMSEQMKARGLVK